MRLYLRAMRRARNAPSMSLLLLSRDAGRMTIPAPIVRESASQCGVSPACAVTEHHTRMYEAPARPARMTK